MDRLIGMIRKRDNPTAAGLDPKLEYLPSFILEKARREHGDGFEAAAAAILDFNIALIDALCDIVPAVKLQSAYYEMYGWQGVKAFADTIAYAHKKGLYVIADVKRNDIGSTAAAYADAYLGKTPLMDGEAEAFGADAVTVNGYLGIDGIEPFLRCCEAFDKDIFVLVKTSNPSSGELQNIPVVGGLPLYAKMGELVEDWGEGFIGQYGFSRVGAVVGATYPQQLKELRKLLPYVFFLVPGYGSQGGSAKDAAFAFNQDGLGGIVNASRSIMCAYRKEGCDEHDFAGAARREALRMRCDINEALACNKA